MRILMWDVHGGYTDSLVAGTHEYLFLRPESGRGGLARYGSSAPNNACARPHTIATSLRKCSLAGVRPPRDRCTTDIESSTVTICF